MGVYNQADDGNIPAAFVLPAGVTLDGNGYTMTVPGDRAGNSGAQWTGYATPIVMTGSGTIKNLTIECETRGIVCYKTGNNIVVNIENVNIVGCHRPINVTCGATPYTVNVVNCTLSERSSFNVGNGGSATFTNCTFETDASLSCPDGVAPILNNCTWVDGSESIDLT